ncbi:MAG: lamin tail domain-containing protein [Acidobacteria bacterium]|nr:lamin tail domain-containing protein [Acidobacteriota bacterium]
MKTRTILRTTSAVLFALMCASAAGPEGPCDIYAAGGAPCVAAHSTTRALYRAYSGSLYQVLRQSDGKTLDVGVLSDGSGVANAAAQDAFCANTYCWISIIYDQSPKKNHLVQAPRGGFSGPAMGGFNNLPVADMAPVTLRGHKVYGVFIAPGMGLRQNDVKGTAVDDQAEGQYWVINGLHYNNGCCFDYGNAEIDSRDDGNGTMETTYYGNATPWYRGIAPGPWIMTDQENNLVGCVNADGSKYCANLPSINWRFVTATADGEPHHWRSMGGDAQRGELKVMFDGPRINATYDPMRKQGAILLGNGGDNSVGSQGTFYEGAMTAAGTFPSQETNQKLQANIVAAKYDVPMVSVAPAGAASASPGLLTFAPGSTKEVVVSFTNTTGAAVTGVQLSAGVPNAQWKSAASGAVKTARPVAPGASVSATFQVTSGPAAWNGDLMAKALWTANGKAQAESAVMKVRNAAAVKINEFRANAGLAANPTDAFIELYNAGDGSVDLSNWTLTQHAAMMPAFSAVTIPPGTKLAAKGFYLLGLANSGLAAAARAGESTVYVRSTAGMQSGGTVKIGEGAGAETRKITSVGTAAGSSTTLWQPLPEGPVMTIPAGSKNVPVTSVAGFEVGQKIALGYGAAYPAVSRTMEKYEVATVTAVGKPGTQAWLSADAKAGETNLKVSSVANISVGDKIRLDVESVGHGIETVTVMRVGTQSIRNSFNGKLKDSELGTGLELAATLKFNHAANLPFSVRGTGISFEPATAFAHSSNEPVTPLGTGLTLDRPLGKGHAVEAVVRDETVKTAGYQGSPAPQQWFGGPAVQPGAGTMVLRNAAGLVVDSLNYGLMVDPWASEGFHATGGTGQTDCRVPALGMTGRGFGGPAAQAANTPHRSAGRFPDGVDTDSNCQDFAVQAATLLAAEAAAGANNIKVANVADFAPGQKVMIDTGANVETVVIAVVGTAGFTTASAATEAGATVIPVASAFSFRPGQAITIGGGTELETAVVASTSGFGRGQASIRLAEPLKRGHAAGAQVSGTGMTLSSALTRAHASGVQVVNNAPTPGAANRFARK